MQYTTNTQLIKNSIKVVIQYFEFSQLSIMVHYPQEIQYSDKYMDDYYEYRHVILPREIYKRIQKGKLLSQNEWRGLGVQQSRGWVHYQLHRPQPHILLFRRPKGTDPQTGLPPVGFIPPSDIFV